MASDVHISREILEAVAQGELSAEYLAETAWQHLMAVCPVCREELNAFLATRRERTRPTQTLAVVTALLERNRAAAEAEEHNAQRDFATLLELPSAVRSGRIERAVRRFRGPFLIDLLLAEAARQCWIDPRKSHEFAALAYEVATRSQRCPGVATGGARALAYQANALRAQGRLQEADERFAFARRFAQQVGITEPVVAAELDLLEAVLHKNQRRFREAESLYNRAAAFYRITGDLVGLARVMVSLSDLFLTLGDHTAAAFTAETAQRQLDAEAEPQLYCCARHNQVLAMCEMGRFEDAAQAFEVNQALYDRFPDRYTQARRLWLGAKIAAGLGHADAAEEALLEVRGSFVAQGIGYDAALVSLELAVLYAGHGRTSELRQLAEEIQPIFTACDLHQEAIATLLVFQEALRKEVFTVQLARQCASALARARELPNPQSSS
jgi:tetratricopeptide (TPR) repeat protein